jgi:hypothetical protein
MPYGSISFLFLWLLLLYHQLAMLRSSRSSLWTSRSLVPYLRNSAACQFRRGYAAVTDPAGYPKIGERLHGFTLERVKQVPELELTAFQLRHDKTGADYLHIARDDSNNVFSIGFKTNPPDDTGVPHILEHTTLCGSEMFFSLPPLLFVNANNFTGTLFAIPSLRCFPGLSRTL